MTPTDAGEEHDSGRFCGGPRKQSEGTCTRPAGWGTPHPGIGRCKLHGGSTTNHVKAAEKQQAAELMAKQGSSLWPAPGEAPPIKDATSALLTLGGQLQVLVDKLGADLETVTDSDETRVRAKALFWSTTLGQLRQLLTDIARLRLGERVVELEAEKVKLTAIALGRVLDSLELDPVKKELALRMLVVELRGDAGLVELEAGGR